MLTAVLAELRDPLGEFADPFEEPGAAFAQMTPQIRDELQSKSLANLRDKTHVGMSRSAVESTIRAAPLLFLNG